MNYKGRGKNGRYLDRRGSFSKDEIKLFEDFIRYLRYKKEREKDKVPLSIFNNGVLAPLETVVKYLREELDYTYNEIGILLNRNAGPIGVSYRIAKRKLPSRLDVTFTGNSIPISVFKNSRMTVFETIVVYLKNKMKLKFKKIAELLNRNYRTIWTVYYRAKKK